MRKLILPAVTAALALCAAGVRAEVVDAQPNGFEVRQTETIDAHADRVWDALTHPEKWWNSEHTWSHDAHNLWMDVKPGGCWCEHLKDGGGAWHLTVIFIEPHRTLRFAGALGPISLSGADGHLTWELHEHDGKTTLVQTYDVGGYRKGGLDQFAAPVDTVLGEQMERLERYVETGHP
jgi:uncharacterized protein YndB with AHSA1/START domain